jgi:succinoglycan biosynthesis transport protein ExoP
MPAELGDRRPQGLEEYWAIVLRRRWWILTPLFLCWAAVWGISWLLPTTYQSEALILVEQQKVPDQYVVPNVTENLQNRLQSITQQILSRTRLQATIDRFRLYSRPHGLSTLLKSRDPIDQMRSDINIDLVKASGRPGDFTAFKIRYSAESAQLAQSVNSELTSLFVEENAKSQRQLSENTTTFLERQLADARARMEEQENQVAAFKAKHAGYLPEQLGSNVQILAGLQGQSENAQHALNAAKQQKIYLESLRQQYQSAQAYLGGEDPTLTSTGAVDKELLDLRLRLNDSHARYTDIYPDTIALKDKIAQLELLKKETEVQIASDQSSGEATNGVDHAAAEIVQGGSPTAMMQIKSQLKANQLEIQNGQEHEKDLESQIRAYQTRLNLTPQTEQELAGISRGYEESKSNYNSLLQKQTQSRLATSLEQGQQGEQFRIIDPPSSPEKPSAPNHFQLSLFGFTLGIGLGLGLAVALELTDVRVQQEQDLEGIVTARVLVSIPRMGTPEENHRHMLIRSAEVGAAAVIVLLVLAGNLFAFYKG